MAETNTDELVVMASDGSLYFRSDDDAITWYSQQFSKLKSENTQLRTLTQKLVDNAEVTKQGYVLVNADMYFAISAWLKGVK